MIAGFLAFSMLATAPESTSAAKVEQGGTKSETNITEYSAATGGAVSGVVTGGAVSEVPTGRRPRQPQLPPPRQPQLLRR